MKLLAVVAFALVPLALACSSAPIETEDRQATESRLEDDATCPEGRTACREKCGGDIRGICKYFATAACVAQGRCLDECYSRCRFDRDPANPWPPPEREEAPVPPAAPAVGDEPKAEEGPGEGEPPTNAPGEDLPTRD